MASGAVSSGADVLRFIVCTLLHAESGFEVGWEYSSACVEQYSAVVAHGCRSAIQGQDGESGFEVGARVMGPMLPVRSTLQFTSHVASHPVFEEYTTCYVTPYVRPHVTPHVALQGVKAATMAALRWLKDNGFIE